MVGGCFWLDLLSHVSKGAKDEGWQEGRKQGREGGREGGRMKIVGN